jgi:excisionase family DNA binding protein
MVQNYWTSYAALLRALQNGLARLPEHATCDDGDEASASESALEEVGATFAADATIDPSTPVLLAERDNEGPSFDRRAAPDAPDASLPSVSSYAEYIALHGVVEANLGGAAIDDLDASTSSLDVSETAAEVDATQTREGFAEPDDTLGTLDPDEQSSVGYFSSYSELVARCRAGESDLDPSVNDGLEASPPGDRMFAAADSAERPPTKARVSRNSKSVAQSETDPTETSGRKDRPELMTPDEVCAWFGISRSTLYNWVTQNRVPSTKVGGTLLRFDRAALLSTLESWQRESGEKNERTQDKGKLVRGHVDRRPRGGTAPDPKTIADSDEEGRGRLRKDTRRPRLVPLE